MSENSKLVGDVLMSPEDNINTIRAELKKGIALPKCQKCGCMENAFKNFSGTRIPPLLTRTTHML